MTPLELSKIAIEINKRVAVQDWAGIDESLSDRMPVLGLAPAHLVMKLRATYPFRSKLHNWNSYKERVSNHFATIHQPSTLLQGL